MKSEVESGHELVTEHVAESSGPQASQYSRGSAQTGHVWNEG